MPVFIVCRDRVTDLRKLVAWLELAGHHRIVLLDNDSEYPPMLDFLRECARTHTVMPLGENMGSRAIWKAGLVPRDEFWAYSDPDVVPVGECPLDALDHLRGLLERHQSMSKAALGIHLDDVPPDLRSLGWERSPERQGTLLEPGVWSSINDTTMAVYRPGVEFESQALRTGWPYACRHLPWYRENALTPEDRFYLARAKGGAFFSSWKSAVR